jgi:hypothetical protein
MYSVIELQSFLHDKCSAKTYLTGKPLKYEKVIDIPIIPL